MPTVGSNPTLSATAKPACRISAPRTLVNIRNKFQHRAQQRPPHPRFHMLPYANLSGDSPIVAYSSGTDHIDITFREGCVYTHTSAATHRIITMQRLTRTGRQLAAYIARKTHDHYAEKRS